MSDVDDTETLQPVTAPEETSAGLLRDEVEENKHFYLERSHALRYWLHLTPIITIATGIVVALLLGVYTASKNREFSGVVTPFTVLALGLLALCYFAFIRERWMYQNWKLELDPSRNAITLYRPGMRKLFIPERNAQTIPIAQTSFTKNEQGFLEQYVFTRSSTVTIDNDIQGDEMFHDMRFVRDGHRLREGIIWYNNLHRREERAELEILGRIEQYLKVLVETLCPDTEPL